MAAARKIDYTAITPVIAMACATVRSRVRPNSPDRYIRKTPQTWLMVGNCGRSRVRLSGRDRRGSHEQRKFGKPERKYRAR